METIKNEKKLKIENINKRFGNKIVFDKFDIEFNLGEINCIIGKSGCGKSTLLNIISGILKNDTEDFKSLKSYGISYIFQDDRLIEWLTVRENIILVAKKHYSKQELDSLCDKYMKLVGIEEFANYYPQMLSGGIRQRVNIARGLIYPSEIIIMDEPFKSIDIINKDKIIANFKQILKQEKRTVLLVTHDIDEAIILAEKIFILGGAPLEIKAVFDEINDNIKQEIYRLI